jgi:hypothetical protein
VSESRVPPFLGKAILSTDAFDLGIAHFEVVKIESSHTGFSFNPDSDTLNL